MRKTIWLAAALSTVAAFAGMSPALAKTGRAGRMAATAPDLSMTGFVVAGVRSVQFPSMHVPFSFTETNHGTTTVVDTIFNFTITHGTASSNDYICPLTSNPGPGRGTPGTDIQVDGNQCEIGNLAPGASTRAAIIVTPTIPTGTVSVKACTLAPALVNPDPVPSNNCKTLSITIM